jgi:hypothetical protein
MDNLIKKIKDVCITILIIVSIISIMVITNNHHQQSILDREFGILLIKEKEYQIRISTDGCGH